jgi:HEAT repeat protein
MTPDSFLLLGATAAALLWAALSAYVLYVSRRRERARATASEVLALLRDDLSNDTDARSAAMRVRPLLERLSRDMILHTAADTGTPREVFEVLAAYLIERWPLDEVVREATAHRRPRDVWRRIAALKVLFQFNYQDTFDLLDRAVGDADPHVAQAALSLLGSSNDPIAVDIMIRALRNRRQPAARVAVHLERSPQRPFGELRKLLTEIDPVVRSWGARLLGEYTGVAGLEPELAALTHDPDPRVRKTAIASLGRVGNEIAADAALRLLADPVPFVRAHAVRALGDLDRVEDARAVASMLGDPDWWVRAAAKQSLESMGPDVWTALVPCLDHADRFVRNGAAEVFQNLGILDNLVVMEAASDCPSAAKIDLLRRIAQAGGPRLTESLVERVGPATGPKVRRLLVSMGLERVGAA